MSFSYLRLLTNQYTEMFMFYKDVLGLPLKNGDEDGPYCEFETGATDIAIFEKKAMSAAMNITLSDIDINPNLVIIFPVMNVDNEYNRLKELGVKFIQGPTSRDDWDVRTAQFTDPDGNIIEINTRLELLNEENSKDYFQ